MDLPTFRIKFPEFVVQLDTYIQAYLDDATLAVDPCVFGAQTDAAIGFLAAHRMCQSPWGQAAKMVAVLRSLDPMGTTVYGVAYQDLVRSCSMGATVT